MRETPAGSASKEIRRGPTADATCAAHRSCAFAAAGTRFEPVAIDLRPGAPKAFYRTPDVVYGTVVIVAVDGKATVEVKEPDGMFGKVISTLPQLLSGGGSAEQVAQVVTETFGADVEVETVEMPDPGNDVVNACEEAQDCLGQLRAHQADLAPE